MIAGRRYYVVGCYDVGMKIYDDLTPALQTVLLHWTRGYTCWTSTEPLPRAKAELVLRAKWAETYGTSLPAWKRQDRKQKGLPNAVALGVPVVGLPEHLQLILMATQDALTAPQISPFSREKWLTRCPELSDYVIVHEPRERGDYAWTWRLQERVTTSLEKHLVSLVSKGDAAQVRKETMQWIRFYAMYGGVRRQLRRLLKSGKKLWEGKIKTAWPGPDPESLPAMIGFRGQGSDGRKKPSNIKKSKIKSTDESAIHGASPAP